MSNIRLSKSIINARVAILYSIASLFIGFFFRKIFIQKLGVELMGLNTTADNLLQLINIAELGIGAAIVYTLYKPLFNKDNQTINEIISIQGWLYRWVAYIVIAASLVLMLFFPSIFEKSNLPLWYAYLTFGVLLFRSLLGYFVNYNQVILSANQEQYKVLYVTRTVQIAKYIFQLAAIYYLENGYIWWAAIEFISVILTSYFLHIVVKRSYPELKTNIKDGKKLSLKYPEVLIKTKQIFVHKIAAVILTQTQPLIIFAYTSLSLVGYYGNYLLITNGVYTLVKSLFTGLPAGIGSVVAEGKKDFIMRLFSEIFTLRVYVATVLSLILFYLTPDFIILWIGQEFLLESSTLILLLIFFAIMISRSTVDDFITAHGIFQDMWAPIVEGALNIGLSILFGYFWGLDGILFGSILSTIIITGFWKPYFLFTRGFKISVWKYLRIFTTNSLPIILFISSLFFFEIHFSLNLTSNTYLNFILKGIFVSAIITFGLFILFYICTTGMKGLIKRGFNFAKNKS